MSRIDTFLRAHYRNEIWKVLGGLVPLILTKHISLQIYKHLHPPYNHTPHHIATGNLKCTLLNSCRIEVNIVLF